MKDWFVEGSRNKVCYIVYALHQLLHKKKALKATIHSPAFSGVDYNARVTLIIQDIEDKFWKAINYLIESVLPAHKALWYCDTNYPAMEKICYFSIRANDSILQSALDFDDFDLFGPMP